MTNHREPPNLVLHSSGLFIDLFIYFWYWGNELTWNTPIELITLNPPLIIIKPSDPQLRYDVLY